MMEIMDHTAYPIGLSGSHLNKPMREFDPRPKQCSRMSFSSDQVTGKIPHLNIPFLSTSEFI